MARLHRVMTTVLIGAIALAISACSKPDEGKAPFAPPADQTREIFTTQVVDLSLKVAAMNIDGTMTQTRSSTLLATAGEAGADGSVTVDTTLDYVSNQVSGALLPTGEMDMGSINNAFAKGLMGKTISANVGSDGNIISTSGIDALAAGVLTELEGATIPESLGEGADMTIKDTFNRLLGEDEMRNTIEHIVLPRPLEKLDPGVTWTRTAKVDLGLIPTNVTYTYTVKERTDTVITIEEAGAYELDQSAPGLLTLFTSNPLVKQMGDATVELSGTGTGTYTLDVASGWPDSYQGTASLTGKFMAGPLNADLGVNVTQDFTSTIK